MTTSHIVRIALLLASFMVSSGAARADTRFGFSSTAASFVGQGQSVSISPSDGFQMGAVLEFNNTIHFYAIGFNSVYNPWRNLLPPGFVASPGDPSSWWELAVGIGSGQTPRIGTFVDPSSLPTFSDPFVSFSGNFRTSNQTSGNFIIRELSFDSFGAISSLAIDFTHFGENNPKWQDIGFVRLNSTIPTSPVPEPSGWALSLGGLAVLFRLRQRGSRARGTDA